MTPLPLTQNKGVMPKWKLVSLLLLVMAFLFFLFLIISQATLQPLRIGQPVKDFSITSFDGQTLHLSDLRGKKVLVNIWASWCGECQNEALMLQNAWQQAGEDVVFIGVDYADTEPAAKQFMKDYGITYFNGPDLKMKISAYFQITGVPETFLIDPEGHLAAVKIGSFASAEELNAFLQQ